MDDEKYIVFLLNEQNFAINIKNIGGVTEYEALTVIPNSSSYLDGIINVRGRIIPIVNLKNMFQMKRCTYDEQTRIILVYHGESTYGFIVDKVTRVKDIPSNAIDLPNAMVIGTQNPHIVGVAKLENELVVILDLNHMITSFKAFGDSDRQIDL